MKTGWLFIVLAAAACDWYAVWHKNERLNRFQTGYHADPAYRAGAVYRF